MYRFLRTGSWLVLCAFVLTLPRPALAYLDPSSGSIILQAVAAGFLALVVTLRLYWHKLLALLGRRQPSGEGEPSDSAPPDAG